MTSYFATPSAARTPAPGGRAAQAAAVHIGPINASRKRCGLAPLTAAEVTREFADVDRVPVRTKAAPSLTNPGQQAIEAMWAGIVGKLNASLPSKQASTGARLASSDAAGGRPDNNAGVDWGSIAARLNAEAGFKAPGRSLG
jgi:hypothetical protein